MSLFNWIKKKLSPKKTKKKEKTRLTDREISEKIEEINEGFHDTEILNEIIENQELENDSVEHAEFDLLKKIDEVEVIDLRNEQPNPPIPKKWRVRGGKVFERDPATVNGIVAHQTAARFGVSKNQIRAAGGDRKLALARRALKISTPVTVFYNDGEPFVVWAFPLEWYSYHGNDFNRDCLAFEIDGDFAGLLDDPSTAYKKKDNPDELTEKLFIAGCRGLKLLVEEGRKIGMPIEWIYAHRQSSPTRRSDPGEAIWKKIVLGYGVEELGLKIKPELIRKKGYNIPKQWDPENGVGDYWDEPKR